MQLDELLERNTKGVQDLLHHELSALALAQVLFASPQPENLLQDIENMLYKRVVSTVEGIFEVILSEMDLEQALTYDTQAIRTSIQTFVDAQVKLTCTDLKDKMLWWKKKLR